MGQHPKQERTLIGEENATLRRRIPCFPQKKIREPTSWNHMRHAPKDGQKIVLKNPAWPTRPVVAWQRIDGEEGNENAIFAWVFQEMCLSEREPVEWIDAETFKQGDPRNTLWGRFEDQSIKDLASSGKPAVR